MNISSIPIALTQGSPEWLQHRASCLNASDLAAAMGVSKYTTRAELIKRLATGITPEVDAATQARFDKGHAAEAAAAPLAEEAIGEGLYPMVLAAEVPGLTRRLSASFDGLTLIQEKSWENKLPNAALVASLQAGVIPAEYHPQMEQGLMLSGAEKCLFTAGDGNTFAAQWYKSDPDLRAKIIPTWKQVEADVLAYVPTESAPAVVAAPVEALPAPFITVTGQLALADNFATFETRLRDFLDNQLIRKPQTDEDFVNLDAQIKEMKAGREALKRAKAQMLAQIEPVDRATKTADMLDKLLQQNCKMAEDRLTEEKDRRKGEIVTSGTARLQDHVAALNTRLGKPYMPPQTADFAGVIKGLKSLASMEEKVNTLLATAKIKASEIADRIDANLKYLRDNAGDYKALFADAHVIVLKAPEDMQALVTARISEHKAEIERQAELAREKIRAEEQARADREARAKLAAEAAEKAMAQPTPAPADQEVIRQSIVSGVSITRTTMQADGSRDVEHIPFSAVFQESPATNVVPMPTKAPAVDTSARIKLGEVNALIAPLSITADGLAALGFPVIETDKGAKLYRLADVPAILAAMVRHLEAVQAKAAA